MEAPASPSPTFTSGARFEFWAQAALAAIVFARVTYAAQHWPIGYDEHAQLYETVTGAPHGFRNHWLAAQLTDLSVSVFGWSKLAVRLPSLVLTGLFLILWQLVPPGLLGRVPRIALLANLSVNGLALSLFASARGYASLWLVGSLAFFLALEAVRGTMPPRSFSRPLAFFSVLLLAPLVHFFALVFGVVVVGAIAVRFFLEGKQDRKARLRSLLLAAFAAIPFWALIALDQGDRLVAHGALGKSTSVPWHSFWLSLFYVPGVFHGAWAVGGALACALVFLRGRRASLPVLLSLAAAVGLPMAALFFGARELAPRFSFAFLIPLVVAYFEGSSLLRGAEQKAALIAGFLVFFLAPAASTRWVALASGQVDPSFDRLMSHLRASPPSLDEGDCFSCSGTLDYCHWAFTLYFPEWESRLKRASACRANYHLSFVANELAGRYTVIRPSLRGHEPIAQFGRMRFDRLDSATARKMIFGDDGVTGALRQSPQRSITRNPAPASKLSQSKG